MSKKQEPITLRQLLQYFDDDIIEIQIACNGNWDTYDKLWSDSLLLELYLDKSIVDLEIIWEESAVRIAFA